MIALIDADILLYRVGFSTQDQPEDVAIKRIDEFIEDILHETKAVSYRMFLSSAGKDNFRTKIDPEYKANRKQPRPIHYPLLKEHLIKHWNAEVAIEQEADDLIGIHLDDNSIACTIDKDILYGLEGLKFDFVKKKFISSSAQEAMVFFYKQLLMGDKVDNIFGIPQVGPKTAEKILDSYKEDDELTICQVVYEKYVSHFETIYEKPEEALEKAEQSMLMNGQLLKIRTKEGEVWQMPNGLKVD